jgi:hypothetical protein
MNADQKKFNFNLDEHPVPDTVNVPNHPIVQTSTEGFKEKTIKKYCKILKWTAIPLGLIELLFILPHAYPLLFTILFPVLGFIGANKHNEYLIKLYSCYLLFLVFIQMLAMIILGGIAYIVLQCIFILFEVYVATVAIRVSILLSKLTIQQLMSLQNN